MARSTRKRKKITKSETFLKALYLAGEDGLTSQEFHDNYWNSSFGTCIHWVEHQLGLAVEREIETCRASSGRLTHVTRYFLVDEETRGKAWERLNYPPRQRRRK